MLAKIYKGELLFTICIAAYVVVLLVLCFGYSVETRLFPVMVIVPTMILIVLRFVSIASPKLSKVLEPDSGMIDMEKIQRLAKVTEISEVTAEGYPEAKVISWIVGLVLLTFLFGILPAIAVFVFLFVKFYGKRKIFTAVVFTVATWIFVYVIFVLVLQTRLYLGVLGMPVFE